MDGTSYGKMPLTFVDQKLSLDEDVTLSGDNAHHLSKSLRLKTGDWIILADINGNAFKSIIKKMTPKEVFLKTLKSIPKRPENGRPTLAIALTKKRGIEKIIDQAVELGTKNIIPFFSERTVPKYDNSKLKTLHKRWSQIAIEAAKQSGLPFKPSVELAVNFKTLCNKFCDFTSVSLLWEGETSKPLWLEKVTDNPLLIIGPEGGFPAKEVELAKSSGASPKTLGRQILRVDTAAIAALSIWGQLRGGID